MSSGPAQSLLVIGRKEFLEFPEWRVRRVRVKIDTGARTSALDVVDYEIVDEGKLVRLRLALKRHRPDRITVVEAPLLGMTRVCSTSGCREQRPVIDAAVRLGPVSKRIRLTLTNRSTMRHRMILGRQALAGTFLVDVSSKYLLRDNSHASD
jgi:hypothetical protein